MESYLQQCWDRRLFFCGFLATIFILLPYEFLLLGTLLFALDFKLGSINKKSLALTFFTAYSILLCPYLIYASFGLNDSWTLSLFLYFVSLSIFHFGEFIVQSYFHYQEANFSSKI